MIMRVQVQKYLFQGASKAIFIRGFLILYEILKMLSTYQFEHQLWILTTHSCLTRYLLLMLYECPANSKACTFTKALLEEINPLSTFRHYVPTPTPFENPGSAPDVCFFNGAGMLPYFALVHLILVPTHNLSITVQCTHARPEQY